MIRFFLILLMIFQTPVGFAGPKKTTEFAPYQNDVALAAANTLKDLETVNGVLTWLAEFVPKEDLDKTRQLIAKAGIHESDFLPEFQVKGNKMSYGRDSITIEPGYVVVNKKKYKIDGRSFYEYMAAICKDNDCTKDKQSLIEKMIFPKAEALGVLAWFGIGVVTGVIGSWLWRRWKARRALRRNSAEYIYDGREYINYELYNRRQGGEQYTCDGGTVYWTPNGNGNCNMGQCQRYRVNPQYLPDNSSCDRQAQDMNVMIDRNSNNPRAQELRRSERSTNSVTKPVFEFKGHKKWQPRRPF